MPFTPAHMVAVLPLVGSRARAVLDPTCLLIGAMAPDFEYFVRGRQVGNFSHSWPGLALFCVPMALLVALLFHQLVKAPALWLAPPTWSAHLVPALGGAWAPRWPAALAGATVGAFTHLCWDGFTHRGGFITQAVAVLRTPVDVPGLGVTQLCRVLQHGSTVLGLGVLALWLWRRAWPAPVPLPTASRGRGWAVLLAAITLGVVLLQLYTIARGGRGGPSIGDRIVAVISGGLAGVVLASVALRGPARRWLAAATRPR